MTITVHKHVSGHWLVVKDDPQLMRLWDNPSSALSWHDTYKDAAAAATRAEGC